jgi:uncharacterized membrane protein (DUF106 family)
MSINQKPKTIASVTGMKDIKEILRDTKELLEKAKRKNDFKKVER